MALNPLDLIGKQAGPISQTPIPSIAPNLAPKPVQIAQASPTLQITPDIAARFRKRLINADNDEALIKIVKDAAKYGVDWSHMLVGVGK